MTEFLTKDFHRDFQNHCINQVELISLKIHEYNSILYKKYYYFQDNFHLLIKFKCEINLDLLFSNKNNKSKYLQFDASHTVDEKYFITSYNEYLSTIDVLNKLTTLIKYYSFLSTIPYLVYKTIIYSINFEISQHLLKGYSFNYPRIGEITVGRVPYKSTFPDWGRSNKFKQYLKDNGFEVKDSNNENGKSWLVDNGLNYDDFVLLKWAKHKSPLRNKEMYRFHPSTRCNLGASIVKEQIPLEDVISMTKTGFFDKLVYLYRNYHDYCVTNYPYSYN